MLKIIINNIIMQIIMIILIINNWPEVYNVHNILSADIAHTFQQTRRNMFLFFLITS